MNISTQNLIDLNASVQLKPGQRMVRVSGTTWMPVGVGGNFMPGGTSGNLAEYYKCASVSSGASQPEGYNLRMQFDSKDFTFTMEDPTKTGTERTWFGSNTGGVNYRLMTYEHNGVDSWALYNPTTSTYDFYANVISGTEVYTNPWDATNWFDNCNLYMDTGTVTWTVSPAVSGQKTWSGYKAVFDSGAGTWSFESDATQGLTYTSVTPVVGGIYSADALVTVSMLYDGTVTLPGCVFYAELKDNTTELKSGQTLTIPQSAVFQTLEGVQCVQLNGTDQITFTPQNLPSGNVPRTYCFWNYITSTPPVGTFFGSKPSGGGSGMYYQIEYYNSGYNWSFGGNNPFSKATAPLNQWNFVAVTYNGNGVYYLYVNKTKYNPSNSTTLNTKLDVNYIGPLAGYYAKARIFDYCLSESEIGTMVDNGL